MWGIADISIAPCYTIRAMKLATLNDGSRDGQLVVVSRDGTQAHYATHIAQRMQQVLDDWNYISPLLQDLYVSLNNGRTKHAFALDPQHCLAPLPRTYQWVHADAKGLQQLASDAINPPVAELRAPVQLGLHVGVVCGDVPMACAPERAQDAVRLLVLTQQEQWLGEDGAVSGWHGWRMAPIALTPDELGEAWQRGRAQLHTRQHRNGRAQPVQAAAAQDLGVSNAGVGYAIAQAARWRRLHSGTVLSMPDLLLEAVQVQRGDTVALQAQLANGTSPWGAVEVSVGG